MVRYHKLAGCERPRIVCDVSGESIRLRVRRAAAARIWPTGPSIASSVGNGADTADTATPGPAGVNISGGDNGSGVPLAVITGTVIAGNVIRQETDGVVTKTNAVTAVHLNDFFNLQTGIDNVNGGSVTGQLNWSGCEKGPGAPGCAAASGTGIIELPFLMNP